MSLNKLATELDLLDEPIVASSEVCLAVVSDGVELTTVVTSSKKYPSPIISESADLEAKYTATVSPAVGEPRNLTAIIPLSAPEGSNVIMVHFEETKHAMVTPGGAADATTDAGDSDFEKRRLDSAGRRVAIKEKRKRVMRLSWTVNVIAWMLLGIGFMFLLMLVTVVLMSMGVHTRGPTEFTWVTGTLTVTPLVQGIFELLIILLSFEIKSDRSR